MMKYLPDDVVESIAKGEDVPSVDVCGENAYTARRQAHEIVAHWQFEMVPVLMALITKIQEQEKRIEMLNYSQGWRKRRP